MRVLCCLDGTNAEWLGNAVSALLSTQTMTIGLVYVVDTEPRKDIERVREHHHWPIHPPETREEEMRQAEEGSANDVLNEGLQYFSGAELLERHGRPEREIVNLAAEWQADLIIICPHASYANRPLLGPKSVRHVARFVLDHAPCPVLLLRPPARDQFPIERRH
jgi:nucleotide-binding universal stress UspA family protein